MGSLNYTEIVKFALSWVSNREAIKYALIVWAVSIISIVLVAGAFLLAFGPLISSLVSNPTNFLFEITANPDFFAANILSTVFLFAVLILVLTVASVVVNLYISVLMNFFAFRSSNTQYAEFPLSRLVWFFVLLLAEAFLVSFFWVHRKAWLLGVAILVAMLFAVLSLFNLALLLVALILFGLIALALIVAPVYLFFSGSQDNEAIVVNKYFLLFPPSLVVLVLLSILQPLFLILFAFVFVAYFAVMIYCSIRVFCNTPVFLSRGTGPLDSIRTSLSLTKGKVLDIFAAMVIGGVVSVIVFALASMILTAIFSFAVGPLIPENIWGAGDFLQSISMIDSAAAGGESISGEEMQLALESIRTGIAQSIAESIAELIVTPFAMLFGVFMTVGIYLQLIPKERARPAVPKK